MSPIRWFLALVTAGLLLAFVGGTVGCTPAPRADAGSFESENPAAKLYAIQHAGDQHRTEDIPQLIAALDSDDPAVRLFAIEALERITGERLGYVPYAPPHERRAAVDRWVEAYEAGRFAANSDSSPGDSTDTPAKQSS